MSPSNEQQRGFDLGQLEVGELEQLARMIEVEAPPRRRREALEKRLSDPKWLARQLDVRCSLSLIIVEALVECGGIASVEFLSSLVCERAALEHELTQDEVWDAVRGWGCLLEAQRFMHRYFVAAIYRPSYEPLRALVGGLTWPDVPAVPDELRASGVLELRNMLLAVARTGQTRVKANKSNEPNRTGRRKFEADITVDGEALWDRLERAVRLGLTRTDAGGRVVPDVEAMRRAAERGWCGRGKSATRLAALLDSTGVTTLEAVRRAELQLHVTDLGPTGYLPMGALAQISGRGLTASWPGLVRAELEGVEIIAASAPQDEPNGYVLPNFDVMLDEATPLSTVVVVGLCAELVRLDRIATFRLTPESVRAGVLLGIDGDALCEALDSVGPRKLPENVRQSVLEWATSTPAARIVRGRVIVLAPAAAERLVNQPKTEGSFEALAPGVVRVDDAVTEAALQKHLEGVGAMAMPETTPRAEPRRSSNQKEETPEVVVLRPAVGESIRRRVREALASGDLGRAPTVAFDVPEGADPELFEDAVAEVVQALESWRTKLPPKARSKIDFDALVESEAVALLAMVEPTTRSQILKRSTKPAQLARRARLAIAQGKLAVLETGNDGLVAGPPVLEDFPRLTPQEIRRELEDLAEDPDTAAFVLLRQGNLSKVSDALIVEDVVPRGSEVVVLARIVDTDQAVSFPLIQVASVLREQAEGEEALAARLLSFLEQMGRR